MFLLLAGVITAFGQTAPISGTVEMVKADGSTEPVEDALVEVFRVDQKGGGMTDKTDKNGHFSFAGVQLGGTYVVSVSKAGLGPMLSQNIRPGGEGSDRVKIQMKEGDGKRLTEEEVRQVLTQASTGQMSAEDKKAQEEYEKNVAEVEAKNKKIESTNATVEAALKAGVEAFNKKDYDMAIAKFDEGINANPDFVGSAPTLLNNKGASLKERAVAYYNKMVTSKDPAEKKELLPKVRQDFEDAFASYNKAWTVSKNANTADISDQKNYEAAKNETLKGVNDTVRLMIRTDTTNDVIKDDVKMLMEKYVASEPDKEKKNKSQVYLGQYLTAVGDLENAVAAYRKAVEMAPDNPDAVGGLGLALYSLAYTSDSMEQKQESLNYMQLYLDMAPKDHSFRDGIQGAVDDLKSQKLKPQKISAKN